jgi:hypothetical protein
MTVLADFQTILGDDLGTVQIPLDPDDEVTLGFFRAGGRIPGTEEAGLEQGGRSAFLIYSVRNMAGTAQVWIDNGVEGGTGTRVGDISPSSGTTWFTQLIAVSGRVLIDGLNRIYLKNVRERFDIKDLICFYHQDSD